MKEILWIGSGKKIAHIYKCDEFNLYCAAFALVQSYFCKEIRKTLLENVDEELLIFLR
jgi:hypothetical protein